ncbi:hypothetical protein HYV85_02815 [Candidatus Woesearchaeota archaeon]|nr:hypothetical protein [Candidatus Woesearchaeota archaeon]
METKNEDKPVTRSVVNRLKEVREEIAKHSQALEELQKEKRAIKTQLQDSEPAEVKENEM